MNVKEAVKMAIEYAGDLPNLAGSKNVSLEEVEFDEPYWMVTLGFHQKVKAQGLTAVMSGDGYQDEVSYKTFKIDGIHRMVVSMKIRSLQHDAQ